MERIGQKQKRKQKDSPAHEDFLIHLPAFDQWSARDYLSMIYPITDRTVTAQHKNKMTSGK